VVISLCNEVWLLFKAAGCHVLIIELTALKMTFIGPWQCLAEGQCWFQTLCSP